ncbi:MAG: hypothetical protein R3277_02230 [Brumimicrobium sp.]|nr:hypothetical protein [Brumimicrobium sp.]
MTKERVYETSVAILFWDEKGFVRLNFKDTGITYDLALAKKHLEMALEISNGLPFKILIDTRDCNLIIDKDAQDFSANISMKIAEAVIVNNLSMRILSKFYMKQNKKTPVRIFSSEEKAVAWLKGFK